MIINLLISFLLGILNALTIVFPVVEHLPTIGGYDIDAALSSGIGSFNSFANAVWVIKDVFLGFMFLIIYYGVKMILKLFLGHRAPGAHY